MRDRQAFTRTVLPNGILFFTYQVDAPIASLEIQLPTGAAHSHSRNDLRHGAVHFLEHMQSIRSRHFPHAHELDQALGLRGCHANATTFRSKTNYWIESPLSELEFATQALIDRVFQPIFRINDIKTERSVIQNERDRDRFYPGHSQISQYYNTEFLSDIPYSREQLYGSDEDLMAMTPELLEEMHHVITSSAHSIVIAVGNSNFQDLQSAISELKTDDRRLDKKMADSRWVNPQYREVAFAGVTRPTLELAWIYPRTTYRERVAIDFMLGLLTNPIQGTLYQELRQEKGWTYGIRASFTNHRQTIFGMSFPMNSRAQIQYIRENFFAQVQETSADQTLIELEIIRRLNNQVYNYQTVSSIMNGASRELIGNRKVATEEEWQAAITEMSEPAWRQDIINRFFGRESFGEITFLPEES